jgi:hypothetical protein
LQYNFGTGGFYHVSLHKKVPAASAYITFDYKDWYVYSAIISAISRFDTRDLEFNQKGAKPLAENIEVGKHFKLFKQNLTAIARVEYTKAIASSRKLCKKLCRGRSSISAINKQNCNGYGKG